MQEPVAAEYDPPAIDELDTPDGPAVTSALASAP
jgi:hypothetical protein